MSTLRLGIIREGKTPPDKRVPLTPKQCKSLSATYPNLHIAVQKSPIRAFVDDRYAAEGFDPVDEVNDCEVLIGVKEVPLDMLLPNKTYFFFSHTIKEQPYNAELLRTVLQRNIRLIDYETLTAASGRRLIGFGRYAGIVGAYNGFLAYGARSGDYQLKPAHQCEDRVELEAELKKVVLPNIKIALTGGGRVAKGAKEILEALQIREVSVTEYLNQEFEEPVFVQLAVTDYNRKKDGSDTNMQEFFEHPERFDSDFFRFAKTTDLYIAGHYWESGSPYLFTRQDIRQPEFRIKVVADISCDIDGPVASTLRPSTIEDSLYGYDPQSEQETAFGNEAGITVMAVDNLPCELPKDASEDFGNEFMQHILPALIGNDPDDIIGRATIAANGALTEHYAYLQNYVDGK
ncbi:MAG: NAD(P)-dependent oxidoreductase [Salibacteraceae bacterium]